MIEFQVDGDPIAKGRPRFAVINGRARAYSPRATADAEERIAKAAQTCLNGPLTGALRVEVVTFHRIPKSLPKAAKLDAVLGALRPTTRPDSDNLAKLVLDALNGIAWEDDKQIAELEIRKFYGATARTVIKVCRL